MSTQTQIESFHAKPSVEENSFAEVVFNLPLKEAFTYIIPPQFLGKVQVGMRVLVPFGRRRITGYVVSLADKWDKPIILKSIADLPDTHPIVSKEILVLTRWLGEYYQSSWGEAIRSALPAGIDDESREVFSVTEQATLQGRISLKISTEHSGLYSPARFCHFKAMPKRTGEKFQRIHPRPFKAGWVSRCFAPYQNKQSWLSVY